MSKKVLTIDERVEYSSTIQGDNSAAIFQGNKITTTTMFVAGLGGASGGILSLGNLIDANTTEKVGYSNFPKGNILPAGFVLLVTGIRFIFDTTTASVTPLIATWKDNAPPAILNGNFSVEQGTTLFKSPVTDITNIKASTGNDVDFREIIPFKLRDNVAFKFILEVAAATAATTAWRLELRCDVYTDPSAA